MNTPTTEAGLEGREQMLALIEKHLGLKPYRKDCVINNGTGRWTDAARYYDLMNAWADAREAATRAEVERLKTALEAFCKAHEMPITGDTSGFEWGKQTMRYPGEHSGGYICSKHGLGYTGSCICCRDEFARHEERLERAARWDRDTALSEANRAARSGLTATATKKD